MIGNLLRRSKDTELTQWREWNMSGLMMVVSLYICKSVRKNKLVVFHTMAGSSLVSAKCLCECTHLAFRIKRLRDFLAGNRVEVFQI